MRHTFKEILLLVVLLFLSSTSLFANNFSSSLFKTISTEKAVQNIHFSQIINDNLFNFYTASTPLIKEYTKKAVFNDNFEEDQEQLNCKKIDSKIKTIDCCHFKQQFTSIPSFPKNSSFPSTTVFFESKATTSLYLIFEVFRI